MMKDHKEILEITLNYHIHKWDAKRMEIKVIDQEGTIHTFKYHSTLKINKNDK